MRYDSPNLRDVLSLLASFGPRKRTGVQNQSLVRFQWLMRANRLQKRNSKFACQIARVNTP